MRSVDVVQGTECHHILLEDWNKMEDARGTLFVSIPTLLDPSLSPPGTHIVHLFTPDWIDSWQVGWHSGTVQSLGLYNFGSSCGNMGGARVWVGPGFVLPQAKSSLDP